MLNKLIKGIGEFIKEVDELDLLGINKETELIKEHDELIKLINEHNLYLNKTKYKILDILETEGCRNNNFYKQTDVYYIKLTKLYEDVRMYKFNKEYYDVKYNNWGEADRKYYMMDKDTTLINELIFEILHVKGLINPINNNIIINI